MIEKKINEIDDGFVFLVCMLEKERSISLGTHVIDIEMKWADGMIGVIPVFSSLEAAQKYGNGRNEILLFGIDRPGGMAENGELPRTKDGN